MGTLIDVSMDVYSGMLVWQGDEPVKLERVGKMDDGAHANVSRIRCSVHTGTHVDAPIHFLPGGQTVDRLPLAVLTGPAWVAELLERQRIRAEDLEAAGIPDGTVRLLLKTRNSQILGTSTEFREDYAGLEESGAEWVRDRGIRLAGIDYLSIAVRDKTGPVHRTLLGAGVILVEGLMLGEIPAGACVFSCLPLKLKGSDGAPARAMVELA